MRVLIPEDMVMRDFAAGVTGPSECVKQGRSRKRAKEDVGCRNARHLKYINFFFCYFGKNIFFSNAQAQLTDFVDDLDFTNYNLTCKGGDHTRCMSF